MVGGCSARFLALNRHKRPEYADLSSETGRRHVRELVADADAFLHNWAPGRAERFGLDAGTLAPLRPGLVYAHASDWGPGFGRRWIGTDYVVQAYSGIGALFGRPSLVTVVDVLGGLVCAEGVLSALLRRARDGRGRRVDSSLLSSALVLLAASKAGGLTRVTAGDGAVPVMTDLATLAADPRFAPALEQAGCTVPAAPWRFES
jgi:crotonobetainyl-CoA:carnitine CoA-transferase CaiB-like acyl-CoA transferase